MRLRNGSGPLRASSAKVSKSTSYVLAGAEAGSKLEKAKALNIPIIDEAELDRLASLA